MFEADNTARGARSSDRVDARSSDRWSNGTEVGLVLRRRPRDSGVQPDARGQDKVRSPLCPLRYIKRSGDALAWRRGWGSGWDGGRNEPRYYVRSVLGRHLCGRRGGLAYQGARC